MTKVSVLAALTAAAMLSGCASGKVYDNNYVRAAAIAGDGGNAVVFAFYDDYSEPYAMVEADLNEARRKAEIGLGKNVLTGHTELLVLGECDYEEILTFMLKEWKVSPSCLVAYGGPYGAYLLKNYDAEVLADSVSHAIEQGKAPQCDIVTVLSGLLSEDKSAEIAAFDEHGFSGSAIIENNK